MPKADKSAFHLSHLINDGADIADGKAWMHLHVKPEGGIHHRKRMQPQLGLHLLVKVIKIKRAAGPRTEAYLRSETHGIIFLDVGLYQVAVSIREHQLEKMLAAADHLRIQNVRQAFYFRLQL